MAEKLASMDDGQINNMVNMMKMNPSLVKSQYEAQLGRTLSDVEFNNMMSMMNPDMLKQATNMMKQNPGLYEQAQQQMRAGGASPFMNPGFTPPTQT